MVPSNRDQSPSSSGISRLMTAKLGRNQESGKQTDIKSDV